MHSVLSADNSELEFYWGFGIYRNNGNNWESVFTDKIYTRHSSVSFGEFKYRHTYAVLS